jgi:hypothetical protein
VCVRCSIPSFLAVVAVVKILLVDYKEERVSLKMCYIIAQLFENMPHYIQVHLFNYKINMINQRFLFFFK